MAEQKISNRDSQAPDVPAKPSLRKRLYFVLRFVAQPLMFFSAGVAMLALLGVAQRVGWLAGVGPGNAGTTATAETDVDYICPMMCTPPQKVPGRCPVCAMELVPASGGSSGGDERSVVVDPATRRVANIQTVSVQRMPMYRTIRAVGEVGYDEGQMKTISSHTDGRFEKVYVDYTGAVVHKGDRLAEFYSPDLYSAQVEYLQATDAIARPTTIAAVTEANQRLRASARQRLIEFGMPETQIDRLARQRKALNRMDVIAPINGTVIERLAVEGQYVKEGEPIFRLADLSTVWLLLKLFPNDAAAVRYGQSVESTLMSMPDRTFVGRIAFIDPEVDKQSRTVSVRVVLDNSAGLIRVGDYAKATIRVPLGGGPEQPVYDPELATKWISPRHPHIISEQPGKCRLSGIEMVPASDFGFTDQPVTESTAYVVPRSAVLSAANESVVYVETETGRFEIRRVVTGPSAGAHIAIIKGLAEGEKVATSGNFLLDSQMQLAGNPSLIDPSREAAPIEMIDGFSAAELAEIQQLPDAEQSVAIEQAICPVTEYKLGSMGVPPKVLLDGKTIFICCEACRESLVTEPDVHLAQLESYKTNGPTTAEQEDSFEVPPIGDMVPVDGSQHPELPTIESIDDNENFEIEIPNLVPPTDMEADGGKL